MNIVILVLEYVGFSSAPGKHVVLNDKKGGESVEEKKLVPNAPQVNKTCTFLWMLFKIPCLFFCHLIEVYDFYNLFASCSYLILMSFVSNV